MLLMCVCLPMFTRALLRVSTHVTHITNSCWITLTLAGSHKIVSDTTCIRWICGLGIPTPMYPNILGVPTTMSITLDSVSESLRVSTYSVHALSLAAAPLTAAPPAPPLRLCIVPIVLPQNFVNQMVVSGSWLLQHCLHS